MSNESSRLRGESGGALVLASLLVAALAAVLMSTLGDLGETVLDRTRARTAADAAALAGLGGAEAAGWIAARNGATLVSFHEDPSGSQVTVVVAVGGVSATARATDAP